MPQKSNPSGTTTATLLLILGMWLLVVAFLTFLVITALLLN
jgi:hypothetical protein